MIGAHGELTPQCESALLRSVSRVPSGADANGDHGQLEVHQKEVCPWHFGLVSSQEWSVGSSIVGVRSEASAPEQRQRRD